LPVHEQDDAYGGSGNAECIYNPPIAHRQVKMPLTDGEMDDQGELKEKGPGYEYNFQDLCSEHAIISIPLAVHENAAG
jgi:hypothetical protein